ncbi:hypothetical protein [Spirosoma daeguense]
MNRIVLFLVLLAACESTKKEADTVPTRLAVLRYKPIPFEPTQAELALAHRLILKRLAIYNAEQAAKNADRYFEPDSLRYHYDLLNFEQYYKQCTPELNSEGEKILFFYCMCEVDNYQTPKYDWRKHPIRVHDGGSCFFAISVNLTREVVFNFSVNGEA